MCINLPIDLTRFFFNHSDLLFFPLSIISEFIIIYLIEETFYLSQFAHKGSSEKSLIFPRSFQKFQERLISIW